MYSQYVLPRSFGMMLLTFVKWIQKLAVHNFQEIKSFLIGQKWRKCQSMSQIEIKMSSFEVLFCTEKKQRVGHQISHNVSWPHMHFKKFF